MVSVELVILMGLQASGKSSFARARFEGSHVVVSKDHWPNARGKQQRMVRIVREQLGAGRSVVVDNTNVAAEDRVPLIALARDAEATVVGYWFESRIEACMARNAGRAGRARVPDVGVRATASRILVPSRDEGFDELHFVRLSGPDGFVIEPWRGAGVG